MKVGVRKFTGIIGNILEHYDNALYGLLAPFIAPLFFGGFDALTALIMTYGIMPLGIITRPLGALFFGWIGDVYGRKQALSLSLLGMAFTTVAMGFLPVYEDVGSLAPLLLAFLRMLQSFFMAGETVGGAIYILEQTESSKRSLFSSIYDASSIFGILLASLLVTTFSSYGIIEHGWRYLFWAGSLTAVFGLIVRHAIDDGALHKAPKAYVSIRDNIRPLLCIALVAGFSYTTYSFAFTLMNGYIPLVTSITQTQVMHINSFLLFLDMLLLPFFGYIALKVGKEKVMKFSALVLAFAALPLFSMLESSSLIMVIFVRSFLMIGGACFAAPYHAWAMEQVPEATRYTVLSVGYAIGSQVIGVPSAAVSLWLYKSTLEPMLTGVYILIFGCLAAFIVMQTAAKAYKNCSFDE